VELSNQGVGGIAATRDIVIVSDRDAGDRSDVFRCLTADDGVERWVVRYPAPGRLDYGSSPRATPLIDGDRVYLFGAFGVLSCVDVRTGDLVWRRELQREFPSPEKRPWGLAASPIVVDGRLIVVPGGETTSLLALDPATGETLWQGPGDGPAFASPVEYAFGPAAERRKQIIAYDRTSLGGWDAATGKRLWSIKPRHSDDFNVPTPIVLRDPARGDRLLVSTENNGTRLFRFDEAGTIDTTAVAENPDLAPDTHSPVAVGSRLFGIWGRLYCLDLSDGLRELYSQDDDAFGDYGSIIASSERLLILSPTGELLLVYARSDAYLLLSRLKLFADESGVLAHPAIVGNRLYVRGADRIVCLEL